MSGSRRSTLDRVRSGSATDVGRVRGHNEDCLLDAPGAWFVADGLGGHAAGEVASRLAVDVLEELTSHPAAGPDDVAALVSRANQRILAAQQEDRGRAGMGTTLTGLTLVGPDEGVEWAVVNVGDSRVYRVDDDGIEQITRDHSEVRELVDAGLLDPADVPFHPMRHIITRSLGATADVMPDTWVRPVVSGERFVVCSDGLSNELDDETIRSLVVGAGDDPQAAADALVAAALEAGGRDNVTVVVLVVDAT